MANILLIEDNDDLRTVMSTMLGEMGHEILEAPNGAEGLKLQQQTPASLIITDLHMPEMDGIEAIKQLRETSPKIKIIAMSGANTFMVETNLETSKNQGADRTFTKPFDHDEFKQAVTDLIEGT
ncbi:MAG: response regulator [Candidatus Hydrogenedentota bacterium]|nr:MAG: response regulator [Candidatus Hydrogenedentota bacterium]